MKKYLLLTVLVMLLAAIGCRFGQPVGSFAYDFPSAEASKNISEKKKTAYVFSTHRLISLKLF